MHYPDKKAAQKARMALIGRYPFLNRVKVCGPKCVDTINVTLQSYLGVEEGQYKRRNPKVSCSRPYNSKSLIMPGTTQSYELVVIGAGPHGLIAAHTWLELYPESRVAILESEEEVECAILSSHFQVTANLIQRNVGEESDLSRHDDPKPSGKNRVQLLPDAAPGKGPLPFNAW